MPRLIRIADLLAVLACSTQWIAPAQGKATIRIATQSKQLTIGPPEH